MDSKPKPDLESCFLLFVRYIHKIIIKIFRRGPRRTRPKIWLYWRSFTFLAYKLFSFCVQNCLCSVLERLVPLFSTLLRRYLIHPFVGIKLFIYFCYLYQLLKQYYIYLDFITNILCHAASECEAIEHSIQPALHQANCSTVQRCVIWFNLTYYSFVEFCNHIGRIFLFSS